MKPSRARHPSLFDTPRPSTLPPLQSSKALILLGTLLIEAVGGRIGKKVVESEVADEQDHD
jgi:hypothetical protein